MKIPPYFCNLKLFKMKQIITILFTALTFAANAQDSLRTKEDTLNEVQIVGLSTSSLSPISQTRFSTSEYAYVNMQKDPFFVLDKVVPSIYAQSDNGQGNGYSYMRMRGIDQTRINFNMNGIPMNEMEDQGIYFSNMPGFYNYLSNISVERGIGSSKYGTTSIGGSVNMETRSMTDTGLEITTTYQARYPGQFGNVFYSSGIKPNGLALQLGTTFQNNSGFKENSGNRGGSAYYSLGYFKKNNIVKLYGFSGITYNNLAFYGVPMNLIDSNYRTNLNSSSDRDTFNQNMVVLNWVNYAKSKINFNSSVYFNNVNGTYSTAGCLFGVNSYQYGAMGNMVLYGTNMTTNIGLNTNIYARRHFGHDNGGFYDYAENTQKYVNWGYKKDVIGYVKGMRKGTYTNIFYDIQARSVWFNTTDSKTYNWLFLNPKVGFKTTTGNNDIYMNVGMTQREPTRTDIIQNIIQLDTNLRYANPDNTMFLKNNSMRLKPETVYDVELGFKHKTEYLDINANVYMMVIRNEYVATGIIDAYSGFMMKKSVDMTMRNGLETNIRVKMNKFNVFINTNIQHNNLYSQDMASANIPFTPKALMSCGVTYTNKNITTGFTSQFVSSMSMNLTQTPHQSQSYTLTNWFADYRYRKAMLTFRVTNLFNSKYYMPAGVTTEPTFYVGELFNYSISLKMRF
jgi:iron complex outermembrane receptor protein